MDDAWLGATLARRNPVSTDATPVCMTRRSFLIAGAGGAAVTLLVPDRSAFGQRAIELVSYRTHLRWQVLLRK